MEELSVLRMRKSELEQQLNGLQDSRKQLMVQLESLMKMIKVIHISPLNIFMPIKINLFSEPTVVAALHTVDIFIAQPRQKPFS